MVAVVVGGGDGGGAGWSATRAMSSTAELVAALLESAVCFVCVVCEVGVGVSEKFNFFI